LISIWQSNFERPATNGLRGSSWIEKAGHQAVSVRPKVSWRERQFDLKVTIQINNFRDEL
jgi:hypothetical protein